MFSAGLCECECDSKWRAEEEEEASFHQLHSYSAEVRTCESYFTEETMGRLTEALWHEMGTLIDCGGGK